jgi:hypothetical protein
VDAGVPQWGLAAFAAHRALQLDAPDRRSVADKEIALLAPKESGVVIPRAVLALIRLERGADGVAASDVAAGLAAAGYREEAAHVLLDHADQDPDSLKAAFDLLRGARLKTARFDVGTRLALDSLQQQKFERAVRVATALYEDADLRQKNGPALRALLVTAVGQSNDSGALRQQLGVILDGNDLSDRERADYGAMAEAARLAAGGQPQHDREEILRARIRPFQDERAKKVVTLLDSMTKDGDTARRDAARLFLKRYQAMLEYELLSSRIDASAPSALSDLTRVVALAEVADLPRLQVSGLHDLATLNALRRNSEAESAAWKRALDTAAQAGLDDEEREVREAFSRRLIERREYKAALEQLETVIRAVSRSEGDQGDIRRLHLADLLEAKAIALKDDAPGARDALQKAIDLAHREPADPDRETRFVGQYLRISNDKESVVALERWLAMEGAPPAHPQTATVLLTASGVQYQRLKDPVRAEKAMVGALDLDVAANNESFIVQDLDALLSFYADNSPSRVLEFIEERLAAARRSSHRVVETHLLIANAKATRDLAVRRASLTSALDLAKALDSINYEGVVLGLLVSLDLAERDEKKATQSFADFLDLYDRYGTSNTLLAAVNRVLAAGAPGTNELLANGLRNFARKRAGHEHGMDGYFHLFAGELAAADKQKEQAEKDFARALDVAIAQGDWDLEFTARARSIDVAESASDQPRAVTTAQALLERCAERGDKERYLITNHDLRWIDGIQRHSGDARKLGEEAAKLYPGDPVAELARIEGLVGDGRPEALQAAATLSRAQLSPRDRLSLALLSWIAHRLAMQSPNSGPLVAAAKESVDELTIAWPVLAFEGAAGQDIARIVAVMRQPGPNRASELEHALAVR